MAEPILLSYERARYRLSFTKIVGFSLYLPFLRKKELIVDEKYRPVGINIPRIAPSAHSLIGFASNIQPALMYQGSESSKKMSYFALK